MKAALMMAALLALAGCQRATRDMAVQPRYGPADPSVLFTDGKAGRLPVEGTVPRAIGDLAATSSGRRGEDEARARSAALGAQALPPRPSRELIERGRARYAIDCLPCHGPRAQGDGPIVQRGFPSPPPLTIERLRTAPDRHFYDVITHGHGVMYPYADRVTPQDRWAVVAFVRSLQADR